MIYWKEKVDSFWCSMLPKIPIISRYSSNKSHWPINFSQKSQWEHMSISPKSAARRLERLPCLKYVTIVTETRLSAQNGISQEDVFNVWSSCFRVLLGGFHWKFWSNFFIWPRIKIECLWFFCNFFCNVISWLWFVNTVPFHIQSWNTWTELFNLDWDKIHNNIWRSGWYY